MFSVGSLSTGNRSGESNVNGADIARVLRDGGRILETGERLSEGGWDADVDEGLSSARKKRWDPYD